MDEPVENASSTSAFFHTGNRLTSRRPNHHHPSHHRHRHRHLHLPEVPRIRDEPEDFDSWGQVHASFGIAFF